MSPIPTHDPLDLAERRARRAEEILHRHLIYIHELEDEIKKLREQIDSVGNIYTRRFTVTR